MKGAEAARQAEALAAKERAFELETELAALKAGHEDVEDETWVRVGRDRALLCESYFDLGAEPTPFDEIAERLDTHFLGWLLEELKSLPTIVMGLMAYASLVTCEGVINALSREGCNHFESFQQSDSDFDREVFQVEDLSLKLPTSALFDCMWVHMVALLLGRGSTEPCCR